MNILLVISFLYLSGNFCASQFYLLKRNGINHPNAELMYSRIIHIDEENTKYEFKYTVPAKGEMRFYNITKYEVFSTDYFKNHVQKINGGQRKDFVEFNLWIIPNSTVAIKVWGTYLTSSPCKKK